MSAALSGVTLNLIGVGHVFQIPVDHVSKGSLEEESGSLKERIWAINSAGPNRGLVGVRIW